VVVCTPDIFDRSHDFLIFEEILPGFDDASLLMDEISRAYAHEVVFEGLGERDDRRGAAIEKQLERFERVEHAAALHRAHGGDRRRPQVAELEDEGHSPRGRERPAAAVQRLPGTRPGAGPPAPPYPGRVFDAFLLRRQAVVDFVGELVE